jgi:hypothetical protein
MKVELSISKASQVIMMGYCPQETEFYCGIVYRKA